LGRSLLNGYNVHLLDVKSNVSSAEKAKHKFLKQVKKLLWPWTRRGWGKKANQVRTNLDVSFIRKQCKTKVLHLKRMSRVCTKVFLKLCCLMWCFQIILLSNVRMICNWAWITSQLGVSITAQEKSHALSALFLLYKLAYCIQLFFLTAHNCYKV